MRGYPEKPTNMAVLRSSTLLNDLREEDFQELASSSHLAFAERGETIWFRGSQVDFFGIAGSGFVKMVRSSASGQEFTAEIIGPGQIFGLLGLIDGSGCPLTARAVSTLWYLKVPNVKFGPIYQDRIGLKDMLVRRTTNRLRQAYDLMARISSGRVEERLAAVMMLLAESFGEVEGNTVQINVPLTRQDLSEMAGTTVESTIRNMSRWQKAGIIRCRKGQWMTIMDLEAMERKLTEGFMDLCD